MKAFVPGLLGLIAMGCTVSPVVSVPDAPSGRYADCDRAARDYCEEVVHARKKEMDGCVADHRLKCVSSSATLAAPKRS